MRSGWMPTACTLAPVTVPVYTHRPLAGKRRSPGLLLAALPWLALPTVLSPAAALACACGCGVFDVGTASMFPARSGGTVFLEEDFVDQNRNWSGSSRAPAADNFDKQVRSFFTTLGGTYSFNADWSISVRLPYWQRRFTTTDEATGERVTFNHGALGDARVTGTYTGFSADRSTGLVFGLKLPTGDYTYANFDRDTAIGTGTTDTLLGAWHQGNLSATHGLNWFVQGLWERALASRAGYRPGDELDTAVGIYHEGQGAANGLKLSPLLQLAYTWRAHDSGIESEPGNTGYTRILIAPGLELRHGQWRAYADVAIPVQQHVSGNQLVAPALYKLILSRAF